MPGDIRDTGLIPGSGRSPGEGHGNQLQYSCLKNPMDKRSLVGYNPKCCKELDTTERPHTWHTPERPSHRWGWSLVFPKPAVPQAGWPRPSVLPGLTELRTLLQPISTFSIGSASSQPAPEMLLSPSNTGITVSVLPAPGELPRPQTGQY